MVAGFSDQTIMMNVTEMVLCLCYRTIVNCPNERISLDCRLMLGKVR